MVPNLVRCLNNSRLPQKISRAHSSRVDFNHLRHPRWTYQPCTKDWSWGWYKKEGRGSPLQGANRIARAAAPASVSTRMNWIEPVYKCGLYINNLWNLWVITHRNRRTRLYRLSSSPWSRIYILYGICEASFTDMHISWQTYNTLCQGIKRPNFF